MTTHALIVGKFYPPHAGHHLLVRTAASQCDRVTVIVMAASHESIPMETRAQWLREVHREDAGVHVTAIVDDVPIDYDDAGVWDQHVALMKEALARIDAPPVTAVFSSEPYGVELARRFGTKAVTLDPARTLAPVSSTRVRESVPSCWDQLSETVRGGLALRVVVVGAESTGTTTLSLALADHLRTRGGAYALTRWVGEYGREYSVEKFARARAQAQLQGQPEPAFETLGWASEEFVHIARIQLTRQDEAARIGGPVLVCDTDPFATAIWHERYLGAPCDEVERVAMTSLGDLYLVTHDAGVPFHQDGLRDGEAIRGWMTQRFIDRLSTLGRPFAVLEGSHQQRLVQAIAQIDSLIARSWHYAAPFA